MSSVIGGYDYYRKIINQEISPKPRLHKKFNNNVKVVEINSEEIPERTLVKCMSMINDCIADKYKINRNQDFDK